MSAFSHNLNEISGYGITLRRLTHDKIELVRRWRNDPKIQQFMEYREEITPEMQEKWFDKINNDANLFYLIEVNDEEIGLINIKDISNKTGEGGVFIWNDKYLNSDVSFRAHLALFDMAFDSGIVDRIISHVLTDNPRALRFTAYLGFVLADDQQDVYNQLYQLTPDIYYCNKNRQRYIKRFKLQ